MENRIVVLTADPLNSVRLLSNLCFFYSVKAARVFMNYNVVNFRSLQCQDTWLRIIRNITIYPEALPIKAK